MEDAIRGPLDVVTIAVSAGGELRDWGLALAPPGVSALWPVLLWECAECLKEQGGSGKGSQEESLGTSVSLSS